MTTLLSYDCEVAVCGYWWWNGDEPLDPERDASFEDACLENYDGLDDSNVDTRSVPLLDSALFLRVAATQPTMEEILDLADQYGPIFGDRIFCWKFEVRILRFMVELWQAVVAGRRAGFIAQHFKADTSGNVSCPCRELTDRGLQGLPFSQAFHGDTWRAIRRRHGRLRADPGDHSFFVGTPMNAAREFLHRAVGVFLADHGCTPKFHRRGSTYEIAFEPDHASSAIWLQFALAVAEDKQFRQCETCGRSFELSPDVNRTSRFHCTNACRVKAYRGRRAKAKRLHEQGKSIEQIVERIGSDAGTIKKWLATKPRKGK